MVLKPPAPRHIVEETQDGLRITLHSKRSVITLITAIIGTVFGFLFFFVAVSVFVVALVSSSQSSTEAHPDIIVGYLNLFFFFVLVFIFAFIGKILYEIFWMFWGREEIAVNTRTFSYFRRIGKWKRTRIFGLENVKDLRVNLIQQSGIFSPFYQSPFRKSGTIAFDYGAKTFNFGFEIDEAEAKQIISALQPHIAPLVQDSE